MRLGKRCEGRGPITRSGGSLDSLLFHERWWKCSGDCVIEVLVRSSFCLFGRSEFGFAYVCSVNVDLWSRGGIISGWMKFCSFLTLNNHHGYYSRCASSLTHCVCLFYQFVSKLCYWQKDITKSNILSVLSLELCEFSVMMFLSIFIDQTGLVALLAV